MNLSRIVIILLLCLQGLSVFACRCLIQPQFNTREDVAEYSTIALVKINELAPIGQYGRVNGDIKVAVMELFKGTAIANAVDPSFNSSCATTLNAGEEWLFFGNVVNGVFQLDACSRSSRYREANGKREWSAMYNINNLEILRRLFTEAKTTLAEKIFYPGGAIEMTQTFRNGKINGVRKIYYPNGNVYVEEKFLDGKRVDYRKIFSESGQLIQHITYKNGLKSKVIAYHDSTWVKERLMFSAKYQNFPLLSAEPDQAKVKHVLDSLEKKVVWLGVSWQMEYEPDGRSYRSVAYFPTGIVASKSVTDWTKQIIEGYVYNEAGNLTSHSKMDKKTNTRTEEDYKSDGSRKDFVEKCNFCDVYFNLDAPPEATPEKIFIR